MTTNSDESKIVGADQNSNSNISDDQTQDQTSRESTTSDSSSNPSDNNSSSTGTQGDSDDASTANSNHQQQILELTRISQQALADLANYKKRTEEEKKQFIKFANFELISQILPVLDNFHRALEHSPQESGLQDWINGINAVIKQLEDVLNQAGLSKIDQTNLQFDPNIHEAIGMSHGEKDAVVKILEHGFMLGDKVIRRSKVLVGQGLE